MSDMPTSALVLPYRIQRRRSTVLLTLQAEVSLPIGQLLRASGLLSPRGDVPPADTAVWRGER
jgi:hypothetical protein